MSFYDFVKKEIGHYIPDSALYLCNEIQKNDRNLGVDLIIDTTDLDESFFDIRVLLSVYLPLWKFSKDGKYKQFNYFESMITALKISETFACYFKDKREIQTRQYIMSKEGGYSFYSNLNGCVCGKHYNKAVVDFRFAPFFDKVFKENVIDWFYYILINRKVSRKESNFIMLYDVNTENMINHILKDYNGKVDKIKL